jgi:hypothetical protein
MKQSNRRGAYQRIAETIVSATIREPGEIPVIGVAKRYCTHKFNGDTLLQIVLIGYARVSTNE